MGVKDYNDNYYNNSKFNRCTDFLLPLILDKYTSLSDNFINCYYYDINYPYLEDKIQLVFDIDNYDDKFWKLRNKLYKSPHYYNSYTYYDKGNKEKIVFCIPPNRRRDYKLILEGNYSKTSLNYKQQILSFWNKFRWSRLGGILYKIQLSDTHSLYLNEKGEFLSPPVDDIIKEYDVQNLIKSKGVLL